MLNEKQLIKNIKNDDYVSYNYLFTAYYNKLCLFVCELIHNKTDAEDIVQEMFIKLWSSRKKIEIKTTVPGYLYQTAKNMALNFIRDETHRKTVIEKIPLNELYTAEYESDEDEYLLKLENCIDRLPERCKEVLLLQRFHGYKQKEIAEKLNISIQTIKNQIWMSLQRLKACLSLKRIES